MLISNPMIISIAIGHYDENVQDSDIDGHLNDLDGVRIDIDNIISIASLSHKYMISQGCYEKVLQLSGKPREFIQRCVVGGRTMTNSNKKWRLSKMEMARLLFIQCHS